MQRKFIYFINPISGTKSKEGLLKLIDKRTTAAQVPFEILHTRKDGNYQFLVEKIAAENITDIIICGGDGTVNQVAASLLKVRVNIGIIPMGSGNGLAFAAGIKKSPDKALDTIFKGTAAFVDSFYINKQFSCMLCGLGFDAQVAHDFARQSSRGLATYAKQTFKNFFSAKPYAYKIEVNGNTFRTEAFFISIANSNQFGNNVTIAPQASLSDGMLDIVVVNKMSKTKMLYSLIRQIQGGKVKSAENRGNKNEIHYFQAKSLTIENPELSPLHIDGDPADTAKKFEIQIIEKAFMLLQPIA